MVKKQKSKRGKTKEVNEKPLVQDTPIEDESSEPEDMSHFLPLPDSMSKESKAKRKSGGFQSMGLSYPVMKGVLRKGYKVPTPIQRKAIPVIMECRDVVAMARTGSGKTGAFLIPMLEKLKTHSSKVGAKALIFSPTRELALQTLKFTKELGRHTSLRAISVLGGEKMEDQFAAVHGNPDVIIATPGRFLHLVIEMDLKLSSVEYVVFDEADRLFEMGFQEQIEEVLHRLPEHRQTLMFSATLPRLLVDFVKAGLTEPVLIRLDVETKLSENLKTVYIPCRSNDKTAILLHLLKNVVNLKEELTVVFLATRHHVEYIKEVLAKASIPCSYIYSSLDQDARKIHVSEFRSRRVGVLLVTDIAARGIDIPLLDNVVNYNFPAKPKLFVHRVGRVARAGRSGTSYSLIALDEAPYLIDLHLFIGKPLNFSSSGSGSQDGVCGSIPQYLIDDEEDFLRSYHESSVDLRNMTKVCENAYKQYVKSRPSPSSESVKRAKELPLFSGSIHPLFSGKGNAETERSKFLAGMKVYRPNTTIFEIGATAKTQASAIMRQKRLHHSVVSRIRSQNVGGDTENKDKESDVQRCELMPAATESQIQDAFSSVIIKQSVEISKKKQKTFKDVENYLPYMSSEHYTEKGLGLQNSFEQDASKAVLDLTADDTSANLKIKNSWHWDRKRKRFLKDDGSELKKKMKTESGVWIPKSYKSDIYKKWQENNKVSYQQTQSDSEGEQDSRFRRQPFKGGKGKSRNKQKNKSNHTPKREMKTKEEILKTRRRKARLMQHQKRRQTHKSKHRAAGKRK